MITAYVLTQIYSEKEQETEESAVRKEDCKFKVSCKVGMEIEDVISRD